MTTTGCSTTLSSIRRYESSTRTAATGGPEFDSSLLARVTLFSRSRTWLSSTAFSADNLFTSASTWTQFHAVSIFVLRVWRAHLCSVVQDCQSLQFAFHTSRTVGAGTPLPSMYRLLPCSPSSLNLRRAGSLPGLSDPHRCLLSLQVSSPAMQQQWRPRPCQFPSHMPRQLEFEHRPASLLLETVPLLRLRLLVARGSSRVASHILEEHVSAV